MLWWRLWRSWGISPTGGGSYKSPLPEAKEGKAPLQIPRSTNPTDIYSAQSANVQHLLRLQWSSHHQHPAYDNKSTEEAMALPNGS